MKKQNPKFDVYARHTSDSISNFKNKVSKPTSSMPNYGLGGIIGGTYGSQVGKSLAHYVGLSDDFGSEIGSVLGVIGGGLLGFKTGGIVKRTGPIYAHKGEYVLPVGVQPTKTQYDTVRKLNKNKERTMHYVK